MNPKTGNGNSPTFIFSVQNTGQMQTNVMKAIPKNAANKYKSDAGRLARSRKLVAEHFQ